MDNNYLTLLICVLLVLAPQCDSYRSSAKIYAKGYNQRNLPEDGGWTQWFNNDHPSGTGDHESRGSILSRHGRGCQGIPCRKPIAMKVMSTHGKSPLQEGNVVKMDLRKGLLCMNHVQHFGKTCADYQIRFFCPNMRLICRKSSENATADEITRDHESDEITRDGDAQYDNENPRDTHTLIRNSEQHGIDNDLMLNKGEKHRVAEEFDLQSDKFNNVDSEYRPDVKAARKHRRKLKKLRTKIKNSKAENDVHKDDEQESDHIHKLFYMRTHII